MNSRLKSTLFVCASGNHYWTRKEDADKCCNGYLRVLVIGGGDNQQAVIPGLHVGRAWVKVEAVEPRGEKGADPLCPNCEGAGGAASDGSCGMCWDVEE